MHIHRSRGDFAGQRFSHHQPEHSEGPADRHPHHRGEWGEGHGRGGRGGGAHFGRGFGGPGGRARRGSAKYLVLDALREGPRHGYEIIKYLEERSNGAYAPSPGTVYPTLQFLEESGLLRSDQESERRVYSLTDAGRADLEAHAAEVAEFWSRLAAVPAPAPGMDAEVEFLKEDVQDLLRTVWRALGEARDTQRVRTLRQIIERSKNEVRVMVAGAAEEAA